MFLACCTLNLINYLQAFKHATQFDSALNGYMYVISYEPNNEAAVKGYLECVKLKQEQLLDELRCAVAGQKSVEGKIKIFIRQHWDWPDLIP